VAVKQDVSVTVGNDKDATITLAIEESKAVEEATWVTKHTAVLPPPPPLPPHAPPQAVWEVQMVPSLPPQQHMPPEYPAWPQQRPWTPPMLINVTEDEEDE
jgi:hypothetical protein